MADMGLLKQLCEERGVSGREEAVRERIIREIEGYADQMTVDPNGSLIVWKRGADRPKKKLLLSAHMDEVGFLVTVVTEDGYLKFIPVGGIDQRVICGRRVTVGEKGIPGVIGLKPIHLTDKAQRENAVDLEEMVIDIGACDREEALRQVQPGDMVCFESLFDQSEDTICAKALDDRAGCAVLIDLIRSELPYDMVFSFVVQEEIGLRGARCASYTVAPDAALVVEATTAADVGGVEKDKQVCRLHEGAVLSFMDRSTIYDKKYYQLAFRAAEERGIRCQAKRAVAGGNDAGAIHVSRGGVRTLAVSLPCRYLHSAYSMISIEDLTSVERLVRELACRIAGGQEA